MLATTITLLMGFCTSGICDARAMRVKPGIRAGFAPDRVAALGTRAYRPRPAGAFSKSYRKSPYPMPAATPDRPI